MVKEIRWTLEAEESFGRVIGYLQRSWTEKEIENFVMSTVKILDYIAEHPQMFRKTNKRMCMKHLLHLTIC